MSLNSVNTNIGAYVALQSLNITNSALQTTQKHISTGYRISDATDDGAAYAIAERVRSDVGALTTANQQLGNAKGLIGTTLAALDGVNLTLSKIRDTVVKVADGSTTATQRTQDLAQIRTLVAQVRGYFADSIYNGKSLIGNVTDGGVTGTASSIVTIRNEIGSTYGITSFSGSALVTSLAALTTATSTTATTALGSTGVLANLLTSLGTQQNAYGAASNYVDNQVTYNSNKIDALNSGLGSLIDADLTKESASLQSLQIRQQLGTQALSISNQAPQTLLSLFK